MRSKRQHSQTLKKKEPYILATGTGKNHNEANKKSPEKVFSKVSEKKSLEKSQHHYGIKFFLRHSAACTLCMALPQNAESLQSSKAQDTDS